MKRKIYLVPVLVALMCLAGWTAHAQFQRNIQARQSWDYMELQLDGRFPSVTKLSHYGAEGWELVTVLSACPSNTGAVDCKYWAYMKRAK